MVGFDSSDDACVYRLDETTAVIQTVDFFPPVVDDPYLFGQIAAANALSDIYAMGATPKLAMNLLCYPACLGTDVVQGILSGGAEKVQEAGAVLAGGHTIEDQEPKYGLCVTGFAHPSHILTNSGAREGDLLVLTKPLGVGILTTAAKAELAEEKDLQFAGKLMAELNKDAQQALQGLEAHACTDVTGFGLLGHAAEMARGSKVSIELFSWEFPIIPAAKSFAEMGVIPAGAYRNAEYVKPMVQRGPRVEQAAYDLATDPQTSGGLLIALKEQDAPVFLERFGKDAGYAAIIGQVVSRAEKELYLL